MLGLEPGAAALITNGRLLHVFRPSGGEENTVSVSQSPFVVFAFVALIAVPPSHSKCGSSPGGPVLHLLPV